RQQQLNPNGPEDAGDFDLVVVGGGYGGMGAALSAARQSLKVAFIQDRFVLGGNGSSEIGVWAMGGTTRGKFPHLGEIIEEIGDRAVDSPGRIDSFGDELKEKVVRNEKGISLFLGHYATGVEMSGNRISAVTAIDVKTGRQRIFHAKFVADTTGHGWIGAYAGADKKQGAWGCPTCGSTKMRPKPKPGHRHLGPCLSRSAISLRCKNPKPRLTISLS
ncbi:MAG: FAD-dependent oxidoreductase, partial [Verrucomicrobia bacterium]|nr:FAD-dependent oxidoreductase [Verrucomicrobiota bacterium]